MIKGDLRMEIKAVFEPRKRVVLPFMCLCFQVVFEGDTFEKAVANIKRGCGVLSV